MINTYARCEGAFIGHAIASNYDPSISMAVCISDSLLKYKQFNGPDVLARYFYLYHTEECQIGETTKYLYQIVSNKIKKSRNKSISSYEDFLCDQSVINESVKITNDKFNGYTAGCSPAQRSFPLALCPWINDDDLFDLSVQEAALTHFNPLAGQVAGVTNLICRSLLRNHSWHDAVQSAFSASGLLKDIVAVSSRFNRSPDPYKATHPAYAPTVLNAVLYYAHRSDNAIEAIEAVRTKDPYYSAPIVGILSGVRWGIPLDVYIDRRNDKQFQIIHDTANKLCSQWASQQNHILA